MKPLWIPMEITILSPSKSDGPRSWAPVGRRLWRLPHHPPRHGGRRQRSLATKTQQWTILKHGGLFCLMVGHTTSCWIFFVLVIWFIWWWNDTVIGEMIVTSMNFLSMNIPRSHSKPLGDSVVWKLTGSSTVRWTYSEGKIWRNYGRHGTICQTLVIYWMMVMKSRWLNPVRCEYHQRVSPGVVISWKNSKNI